MAIIHHKITGHLTLFIADQIHDVDHRLDEVNLQGTVTWTPVLPKGVTNYKATEPPRLVSFQPITSLVADGEIVSLSGTVSEIGDVPGGPGQELPVMVDDMPVWWQASFSVKYRDTPVTIPTMLVDATEGDVDLTSLVSAGGFPEAPTGDIEAIIATVRSMSRAAEDAIRRAEAAAELVGEVDEAARDAVQRAGESATAAEESAARAEAGADRVGTAEAVLEARDTAVRSAAAAGDHAADADQSASAADTSATNAATSATNAAGSAGAADSSAQAAAQSASAAEGSATSASTSAGTATGAATTATNAAGAAEGSAESAAGDRSAAEQAADDAARSATDAAGSATDADAAATRAEAAADTADGAALEAVTQRVDALLEGAPEAYDTLAEIAEKLADQDGVDAALVAQIAGKVDQTTAANRLHGTNSGGSPTAVQYASAATANTIPYRVSGGRVAVGTPTEAGDATTKGYVDSGVSSAESAAEAAQATADAALPADRIQVVDELPSSPAADTIYLVRE